MTALQQKSNLQYKIYKGSEIAELTDTLYHLSNIIFREYPYLYEPDLEKEGNYMERYVKMKSSFVMMIYDGNALVGAATAGSLAEECDHIRISYEDAGYDLEKTFYYGEAMLLPTHRGTGFYKTIMEERRKAALNWGATKGTFISVNRPDDHPLKPQGYTSLKSIWNRYGFFECPNFKKDVLWKDVDLPEPTLKSLTAWVKDIS